MSSFYKYKDPFHTYIDPETGLLRNLQGISDPDVFTFVESGVVTKRLQELYENPIKILGCDSLFKYINIYFKTFMIGQVKGELLR